MEHNTDRILWTVLVLAIGVALFVSFKPAATGILGQTTEKTQTIVGGVYNNPNLIVQSDLKNGWLATSGNLNLKNGYLDPNTGDAASTNIDFYSENYIATNGETVFTFSSPDYAFKGNGDYDRIIMYDSDKNYLGYQPLDSATQTLTQSNVAYIRFSINSAYEGNTTPNASDWLANHRYKLEKGSIATPYKP